MFVMNLGCSPHFKQRGEVGFWRSCFSMPHRMPARHYRQVKNRRHYCGGLSSPCSQRLAVSALNGSGRSHSKQWSERSPCLPAEGKEPSASRNAGKAWSGRGVAWLDINSYRLHVHSV